jgi:UDP-glucose 4-epimerase
MVFAHEHSPDRVGIYNIGSHDAIDVRAIANIVCTEMSLEDVKYHWTGGVDDGRGWKGDVKTMLLATEKLEALGWKAGYGSEEAVRLTARELLKG